MVFLVLLFQNQAQRKVNAAIHSATELKVLLSDKVLYAFHLDNKFSKN